VEILELIKRHFQMDRSDILSPPAFFTLVEYTARRHVDEGIAQLGQSEPRPVHIDTNQADRREIPETRDLEKLVGGRIACEEPVEKV
jgi:hypothetical protein